LQLSREEKNLIILVGISFLNLSFFFIGVVCGTLQPLPIEDLLLAVAAIGVITVFATALIVTALSAEEK